MGKTKKPTGLGIARSGNTFVVGWSRPVKYDAQNFKFKATSPGTEKSISIKKTTTSLSLGNHLNINNYHPKKSGVYLTKLHVAVRGKDNSKWSAWATKDLPIYAPPKPVLEAGFSTDYENRTTFSWGINWGGSDRASSNYIFKNYQWWTTLIQDSDLNPEQVTTWAETGITSDDVDVGSKTIDETTVFSDNYSYTRYFKLVARGPAGNSAPSYAKHVYAFPNPAHNVSAYATRLESNQGYRVSVSWTADATKSRPIDSVSLEYAIETPISTYEDVEGVRKITMTPPAISSWQTVSTIQDTTDKNGDVDGAAFIIDGAINDDKCIFVRVVTKHDAKTTPSDVVFVNGGYGLLSAPSGLTATITDNIATISLNNNSSVSASFVGIYYRTEVNPTPQLIGIWPAGNTSSISVQIPDPGEANEISLGMRTLLADYSPITPAQSGVTEYALRDSIMESSGIVWDDRPVPKPPSKVSLTSPRTGVVRVNWDWTWTSANGVELSWADHDDAWESTDGPQAYVLENTRASAWNVAGLDVGTWHFRVRLFKTDGDSVTYGTYSDIESIKIAASPATPVLTLSPSVVAPNGKITCYWAFTATEGDEQTNAVIDEVILDSSGAPSVYTDIGIHTQTEQYITMDVPSDWVAGSTHYLSVKIITASGEESNNWSIPKPVKILDPLNVEITSTSLENVIVIDDEDAGISHTQLSLTDLPLSVSATGAGEGGIMTYIIERAEDYYLDRPDESETTGFEHETIALITQPAINSEGSAASFDVEIGINDLLGPLDDSAKYSLIAIAQDSFGQTAQSDPITFQVNWSHKAVDPSADIEIDQERMVAFITPTTPSSGYETGDSCDIYRLSVDKPELIVSNAIFGTKYVDPYPTLGEFGGHLIVYKTSNGSYITNGNTGSEFAWTYYDSDSENTIDILDVFATVIDFGDDQLVLPYDLSLSNRWSKDFTMTKYLGGAIEGDWNPAVERTGSIRTRVAVKYDSPLITALRRLATYAGVCHVRTPDGSSFAANVNVNEDREERKINMIASFTLDITKVDSEGFDGITYEEWVKNN